MANIDKNLFLNPEKKYRVNHIVHNWQEKDRTVFMDALNAYGYGGVVTNPNQKRGFFTDPENLDEFEEILKELKERDLAYWIYDEKGYPSGYANGHTLIDHPELEAKGFYMTRRVAYEPRHTTFTLDDESDKIVWAAKYPIKVVDLHESYVQYDQMQPIPFTDTFCECDLGKEEALFIFCSKPAYEGSHCTHNVSLPSFSHYINIMDPRAVRRFIDIAFEPIHARIPDAYSNATAVFTDEPSLQVGYARSYETWPYALAPWVDGLFEEFEAEYGYSMLPWMPLLFEGGPKAYPIRVDFYRLVGKLIARAYSGQLAEWCEAHGGRFSGHYLGEESMTSHVKDYGSYVEVLKATSYPGIDVLHCYPEIHSFNTSKHGQMIVRKKGTNGMMAEISPFVLNNIFSKDPIENMSAIMGIIYMNGVRTTHSYFMTDFGAYDPRVENQTSIVYKTYYLNQESANKFNEYVGRLGYMFDGLMNDCNTFVYYGVEDVQAKMVPQHTAFAGPERDADKSTSAITKRILNSGFDFYYADRDDIVDAGASLNNGKPMISGNEVKTVIVPAIDVMYDESVEALIKLAEAGVTVLFLDKLPRFGTNLTPGATATAKEHFTAVSADDILDHLNGRGDAFTAKAEGATLIKARYFKDGQEMYFINNYTRGLNAEVKFDHTEKKTATVYNPVDGSITPINMGETYTIPSFRGVFVLFD